MRSVVMEEEAARGQWPPPQARTGGACATRVRQEPDARVPAQLAAAAVAACRVAPTWSSTDQLRLAAPCPVFARQPGQR
jgi:hypothetical protein